jgi:hypothetical protein
MNRNLKKVNHIRLLEIVSVTFLFLLVILVFKVMRENNMIEQSYSPGDAIFNSFNKIKKGESELKGSQAEEGLSILESIIQDYSVDDMSEAGGFMARYANGSSSNIAVNYSNANKAYNVFGIFNGQENEYRVLGDRVFTYRSSNLKQAIPAEGEMIKEITNSINLSNYKSLLSDIKIGSVEIAPEELDEFDMLAEDLYYYVEKFTFHEVDNKYRFVILAASKDCLDEYIKLKGSKDFVACDNILKAEFEFDSQGNRVTYLNGGIKFDRYQVEYVDKL